MGAGSLPCALRTSCVTAYELGKSGSLAKLLSIHLQHLISGHRNSVQRRCNLIVKGLTEELKDRLARYGQIKLSMIGRKSGKTISAPVWFVAERENLYLLPVHGSETQ